LAISFAFTEFTPPLEYPTEGAAFFLRSASIYEEAKVDAAMTEWLATGWPTDAVDGLIFVGSPGTLNQFVSP
jgi:hypothetical protein